MQFEQDPKNTSSGGGNDNDGNDFPDIPTNDRGQLTSSPISPNDYPDMDTNDWGQRSLPDLLSGDDK